MANLGKVLAWGIENSTAAGEGEKKTQLVNYLSSHFFLFESRYH
jgi:hypothetical protein